MLAFGFANLAMLGWLAAAAVPLFIHLWSRRKHREAPWAAVEFLLAAIRKNARRMQFEQWLLLAVRTLIILLVVLAVAEPYAEELGVLVTPYRPSHKVFVLDGSYSMAYRQADETLFERARHMIADIVDASRPGDAFSLVLTGEPSRAIVQTPARSASDFQDELDSLELPHSGGDLIEALTLVEDLIERAEGGSTPLAQHEVYILTDLGRTSWQPDQQRRGHAQIVQRLEQLARRAATLILDVGPEEATNAAVVSLSIEQPFLVVRQPTTFTAEIRNFGQQARPQVLVELEIDGLPIESQRIDLAADGNMTVSFTHVMEEPGSHTATVRLASDFLAIDDQRHVAFVVRDQLRALLVSGKRGSATYLSHALHPNPSAEGLIQSKIVSEIALAETELSEFDCVFLANVAQITSGERRVLERYLRRGGGLVFFLGDQVMPDVYNEVLGPGVVQEADGTDSAELSILPAALGELVRGEAVYFDPPDYRHPIVKPFGGNEKAGLLSTPVYQYYRLHIPENRARVQVALNLADGSPAVVTAPVYRGRCVLVATAGSLVSVDSATGQPWTYWPAWPSFLPIIREILNYAVAGRDEQYNALVGQPIGTEVEVGSPSLWEVVLPAGGADTVRVEDVGDGPAWRFAGTDKSGVYQARPADDAPSDADALSFAVNVDTTESDLARIDPAVLPSQIGVRSTWREAQQQDLGELVGEARLHRGLLMAALGLMLIEPLLAWRFGRRAA
jgi:hypothetical protein